jgi:chromate transporter
MNLFVLYFLLLKASLASFTGLGSLPMIRNDFVVERHALTDHQLNTAVVAGRAGPGPFGLYLVCIGYTVAGVPGAFSAFLSLITPAFLVLPVIRWLGRRAGHPRIRDGIRGLMLGSAGLLLASSVPLARDANTGPLSLGIMVGAFLILAFTRLDSMWLMAGAAALGWGAALIR